MQKDDIFIPGKRQNHPDTRDLCLSITVPDEEHDKWSWHGVCKIYEPHCCCPTEDSPPFSIIHAYIDIYQTVVKSVAIAERTIPQRGENPS